MITEKRGNMNIVCLDLEGVLVPEIWIAFAEETGIPELKRTTRDEPDYDKLMNFRIAWFTADTGDDCQNRPDTGRQRVFG